MNRIISVFLVFFSLSVIVSGCGPKSPSRAIATDVQSIVSRPPQDGFDALIICRPWKFVNSGVVSAFLIDDTPAVNFKSGCARFDVKRGKHRIIACITDYDKSKWGKGIVVETKKDRPTVVVFDGSTRTYMESPDFPFQGITPYQPENPVITTTYVSDDDRVKMAEAKRQESKELAEIEAYKTRIGAYIREKDYAGLKVFVNQNPRAAYYIPDHAIRLLFIGPERLQVGDIINYKKKKISDVLLISKIKSSKTPYKQFSMEEILLLQEYNISDALIAAMIDVTTEIEKDMARDEKQRQYLEAQRAFMDQNQSAAQATGPGSTVAGELGKQVGKEIGKEVMKSLLNNIF